MIAEALAQVHDAALLGSSYGREPSRTLWRRVVSSTRSIAELSGAGLASYRRLAGYDADIARQCAATLRSVESELLALPLEEVTGQTMRGHITLALRALADLGGT